MCQGLTYDTNSYYTTLLITSTVDALKVVNNGYPAAADVFIVVISDLNYIVRI